MSSVARVVSISTFCCKIYEDVKRRGHTMQFWGDIIVQHPELIPELPRRRSRWNGAMRPTIRSPERRRSLRGSGVPFYVCPGTSTWNTLAGRTDNALGNLLNAAENGLSTALSAT